MRRTGAGEREIGKFVWTIRLHAPVMEKEVRATYQDPGSGHTAWGLFLARGWR